MPDAGDFGVIDVPLQGIPPGKSIETTSNHQLTPEQIRPSLYLLILGHALLDPRVVRPSNVHRNPTARPLFRFQPATMRHYVTVQVWNSMIFLNIVTPNDGALEARPPLPPHGAILALEVARRDGTFVRVRTPESAGGGDALLGFGGGGREGRTTEGF